MAKRVITIEQVRNYNQMVFAAMGTKAFDMVALFKEFRDEDTGKWGGNPYRYLYPIADYDQFEDSEQTYYIKTVNGVPYLYMDLMGDIDTRYCLEGKDVAKAFFGV